MAALIATLLGGCTVMPWAGTPLEQLALDIEAQRYADALAIIDDTPEDSPQYAPLQHQRLSVIQASQEYREDTIGKARNLVADGHWRQAYAALEQARGRVIDAAPIADLLARLHEKETAQLRDLLATWYQAQAQALLSTEELGSKLGDYADETAAAVQARRQALRHTTIAELTRLGNEYADQTRWRAAHDSLRMVVRLDPEHAPPEALAVASRKLDDARDRAASKRRQAHREHALDLIEQYRISTRLEDLLAARAFLEQHSSAALSEQRRQVNDWCRERFRNDVDRGDALYAQGHYRAAYLLWKQAQPLDPDNPELKEKLKRGHKVLQNLKALSEPKR